MYFNDKHEEININSTELKKTLTIGVPTYNRDFSLERFFPQLISDIGNLSHKVALIVSDNNSTDNTFLVCEKWIKSNAHTLEIIYVKNDTNIGVSKNLTSLFYLASTPYFMFLGDDDRLNPSFFPELMSILESREPPSAVIQSLWNGKVITKKSGHVDFDQILDLFYVYGNAWASIINTSAAINAIESRNLRSKIENIVWPQTVIGFLAIYDQQPKKVFLVPNEIGSQLVANINITNKTYWKRSLYDLLQAAIILDDHIDGISIRRSFIKPRSKGFLNHIRAIAYFSLFDNRDENTKELRKILRDHYGVSGLFWSYILNLTDSPRFMSYSLRIMSPLYKVIYRIDLKKKIQDSKLQMSIDIKNIKSNNKRLDNWF